ncbi:MAG: adenylyltransferase/cytidyltransferase family protein [Candidatus Pacebacteria bacterium]|nr:adenylyltransferase/cytidyltransferase family protein [Candidatus Paceibacterota bacterium]
MIITEDQLEQIRIDNPNKKIVFTAGCFDLFHVGHLSYLEQAKQLGDILVVDIINDNGVSKLKGPKRPVIPSEQRAKIVNALRCVDYVLVYPDLSDTGPLAEMIRRLRPDLIANGNPKFISQIQEEFPNMTMVHIPVIDGTSTTKIVSKINE